MSDPKTLPLDSCPRPHAGVAERIVDGEALLVHAERGNILVLNDVGARVWQLLDGQASLADVVARIADEFDVDASQAEGDVLAFVASLDAHGALET